MAMMIERKAQSDLFIWCAAHHASVIALYYYAWGYSSSRALDLVLGKKMVSSIAVIF